MDISIPMKVSELKRHLKKYAGCAGRIIGEVSMLYLSIISVHTQVEKHEMSYVYEFKQKKLFNVRFLTRLN